jgi:hypothetical protein
VVRGLKLVCVVFCMAALPGCSTKEGSIREDLAEDTSEGPLHPGRVSGVAGNEPRTQGIKPLPARAMEKTQPLDHRTRTLLLRIANSYEAVEEGFFWPSGYFAEERRFMRASHQRWMDRFNDCPTADCRDALASDELDRLNFSLGRTSKPVPSIPFRTGKFDMRNGAVKGSAMFLPLDDGRVFIGLSSFNVENASDCRFFGYVSLPRQGKARVIPFEDPSTELQPVELELLVLSRRKFTIKALGDVAMSDYCGLWSYLGGTYTARV